jgi:hypothetical protein
LVADSRASCWGSNTFGHIGDGTTADRAVAIIVEGGVTFATLRVGPRTKCGISTACAACCWADRTDSQLRNGTAANSALPVLVASTMN